MTLLPVVPAHALDERPPERRWLIEGLWSAKAVGIAGGEPKCCKSFLALDLAVSVASGTSCLGRFRVAEQGRALVFAAEDALHVVRERLVGICAARGVGFDGSLDVQVITADALRIDLPEDRLRLHDTVAELRPRVLVLDPTVAVGPMERCRCEGPPRPQAIGPRPPSPRSAGLGPDGRPGPTAPRSRGLDGSAGESVYTVRMSEIPGGPLGERDLQKALAKIRFGSPWAPEWREYFRELDDWFFGGRGGSAPEEPLDVLEPFRQAWGHPPPPKRPVSIRVDEWLLALVKEMGRQVGMPYQEIVRIWMEDGMRRALTDGLREPEPTSLRSRENKNHRAQTARRPSGPPAP